MIPPEALEAEAERLENEAPMFVHQEDVSLECVRLPWGFDRSTAWLQNPTYGRSCKSQSLQADGQKDAPFGQPKLFSR